MEISKEKRQFQIVGHTQKYLVWFSPVKNALLSISLLISSDSSFSLLEGKVKERLISICTFIHLSGQVLSRGTHIFMSHQYLPCCVTFVLWGCLMPTFIGAFQYLTFAALKAENLRPCCKNSFRKRCVGNNSPPEQNGCPSMVVSHSARFFCVENKREFERWVGVWIWPLVILWNYTDCLVFNVRQWNRFL